MSNDAEKAKEQAAQAGHQAKAAAKSGGRAVRDAAEPVVEAVADEARDVADKAEATAEDAVEALRRVNRREAGVGFIALAISISSGVVAFTKLRTALAPGAARRIS